MKKIFLLAMVLALFATGSLLAQVSGGVKAGLNLADLTGDVSDVKMKVGYHFGGFINLDLTEQLSLQPELLFNAVGASEDGGDGKININYISVPVMVLYSFGNVNIQAGPQIGFLLSAKRKDNGEDEDIKDLFKSTDFGFNLGLGADFGKLNASARYCIGLSNIGDDEDVEIKNGVFQIALGLKLFGE